MGNKVAYITSSFETLSHTFIRREVEALRLKGVEIDLFAIRPDGDMPKWRASYLYPVNSIELIQSNFKVLLYNPTGFFKALNLALFNTEKNIFQYFKFIYHFFLSNIHSLKLIRGNYDHIHAHFLNVPASIAMFSSLVSRVPYSLTVHSAGEQNSQDINAVTSKIKHANFIRLIASYLQQDLDKYFNEGTNIHMIRCGLEVHKSKNIIKKKKCILAVGIGRKKGV